MNIKRYSLHKIGEEFSSFDPYLYSRFKYGSKSLARHFGTTLGGAFTAYPRMKVLLGEMEKDVAMAGAPYKYIPVASTTLKDYVYAIVNAKWSEKKKSYS